MIRGHQHPRRAVAALQDVFGGEGGAELGHYGIVVGAFDVGAHLLAADG
jgi:hypothetical protein